MKRKYNMKTTSTNQQQPIAKKKNIQASGSNDDIPWSKSKKKRMRKRKRIEAEREANNNSGTNNTRLQKFTDEEHGRQTTEKHMDNNKKPTTEKQKSSKIDDNINSIGGSREISLNVGPGIKPKSALQSAFLDRLKGSRFRELNEVRCSFINIIYLIILSFSVKIFLLFKIDT